MSTHIPPWYDNDIGGLKMKISLTLDQSHVKERKRRRGKIKQCTSNTKWMFKQLPIYFCLTMPQNSLQCTQPIHKFPWYDEDTWRLLWKLGVGDILEGENQWRRCTTQSYEVNIRSINTSQILLTSWNVVVVLIMHLVQTLPCKDIWRTYELETC